MLRSSPERVLCVAPGPEGTGWRSALQALAFRKGEKTKAVLANGLVRYSLLPASEALKGAAEWEALARHRLAAVHGEAVGRWDVRVAETAPKGPRLACAVERELLEAIDAAAEAAGARLVSVVPALVAAFNAVRAKRAARSCWLALAEPGRVTFALIAEGRWLAVRMRRVDEGWRAALPHLLAREAALAGLDGPCPTAFVWHGPEAEPELLEDLA